jgi:hypothetical protein
MWPWLFWPAAAAAMPSACGPLRLTLAPPAALWGPFAAFAPVWALAMDPGRNPWLAVGVACGPFAAAVRLSGGAE